MNGDRWWWVLVRDVGQGGEWCVYVGRYETGRVVVGVYVGECEIR